MSPDDPQIPPDASQMPPDATGDGSTAIAAASTATGDTNPADPANLDVLYSYLKHYRR